MNQKKEINDILKCLRNCFSFISNYIKNNPNIEYSTVKKFYPELFRNDTFDEKNSSGDNVALLDLITNHEMKERLSRLSCIRMMVSEEDENIIYVNKTGKYIVAFDPLDGSSNIDVNITVGSIFGIYKANLEDSDKMLHSGRDIICSGYCLYGGSTQLVYAREDMEGIQMETFIVNNWMKNLTNQWEKTISNYTMPDKGKIYSVNESNRKYWDTILWETVINKFIDKGYTARWVGSLVADAHRTLLKGGFFAYPENTKNPLGRIRLLYEAWPMAYVLEKAGGIATDGRNALLTKEYPGDDNIHIKTPIVLSSLEDYKILYKSNYP